MMMARKQMGRTTLRVGLSVFRSISSSKGMNWMQQAEAEARASAKGRTSVAAGESPSSHLMDKLEHEMQGERVQHATNLTDKLTNLIAKCHENAGNRAVYSALRSRAISTRQELIVQREASGMALDQQVNTANIEAQFPIPPMQ